MSGRRPNVVFILADDIVVGNLGCYGQEHVQTPHLDVLAAAGARFTNHHAGSSICAPSRCTLFTGVDTGRSTVRWNSAVQEPYGQWPLRAGEPTLFSAFKSAGYRTGVVGKWALGHPGNAGDPALHGVDSFFGFYCQWHAHNSYPAFVWRDAERVELDNEVVPCPHGKGIASYPVRKGQYVGDLFRDEALRFLDDAAGRPEPFLLYLPFTNPHSNGEAPAGETFETPSLRQYADEPWSREARGCAASISYLDDHVGEIRARLASPGLAEDTLVVFSSDHGSGREHDPETPEFSFFREDAGLRGRKGLLYQAGLRVPLIAAWPGVLEPGAEPAGVNAFCDVLPTLCGVAGVPAPAGGSGRSFAHLLGGSPLPAGDAEQVWYWESHHHAWRHQQAVRRGRWKAVRNHPLRGAEPVGDELFVLDADPREADNLAEAEPGLLAELLAAMDRRHTPHPHPGFRFPGEPAPA